MVGRPPLLVIVGPTGIGKTAVAVRLARRVPLEVVSADSRQVYRGMDVGTGKPTRAERAQVVHHLLDLIDPSDRYHAARFRRENISSTSPKPALSARETVRRNSRPFTTNSGSET